MDLLRRFLPPRRRPWTGLLVGLHLIAWASSQAQAPGWSAQEYQVKAAFLYNFAKFVDWPPAGPGAKDPLVIVVFGQDPFGPALENTVWGKSINNRPVAVRRASRVEQVMPCHVLFISREERRRTPEVLEAVESAGVLTVSEADGFLDQGGAVQLLTDGNRVRFEINLGAARRSGLNVSSKLLSLARAVKN
jgi:hypothetical protein